MTKTQMPHLGHDKHLCYLNNLGFQLSNPEEYEALVKNGKFFLPILRPSRCQRKKLCKPIKL